MKVFETSKRPLLIFGAAIHGANAEEIARQFTRAHQIPAVCTWGAIDLFHHDDPLYFGGFGTHGVRYANFAVQNADVILAIGSRLDTKATGSPPKDFAPKARSVFMVDIDPAETGKFARLGRDVIGINKDVKAFMLNNLPAERAAPYLDWLIRLNAWKLQYPPGMDLPGMGNNPYRFVEALGGLLRPDDVIVSDTGCSLGWMCQAFKFSGQRMIHGWNNTPMGYGLPAAIGAAFATGKRIICITGDGGLGVNVTEFATIARHQLNIKTILFRNRAHAMCVQTQRTWLHGATPSTTYEGGLATPDFEAVAHAYDIPTYKRVEDMLAEHGPGFFNLEIHRDYCLAPQVQFGRQLDDATPLLPPDELQAIRDCA